MFACKMHVCDDIVSSLRFVPTCPAPPVVLADPAAIKQAVAALHVAKRPLVIIGKGSHTCYMYIS